MQTATETKPKAILVCADCGADIKGGAETCDDCGGSLMEWRTLSVVTTTSDAAKQHNAYAAGIRYANSSPDGNVTRAAGRYDEYAEDFARAFHLETDRLRSLGAIR